MNSKQNILLLFLGSIVVGKRTLVIVLMAYLIVRIYKIEKIQPYAV